MPVDLCTPGLFVVVMATLPIIAGIRGTRAAFAVMCGLCFVVNLGLAVAAAAAGARVFLPYLLLLWAVPNAIGFTILRMKSRRPIRPGFRCQICGYDLRATPDRCPECGHIPTKAAATAIAVANAAADALDGATTDAPARNPADGAGCVAAGASAPRHVRR